MKIPEHGAKQRIALRPLSTLSVLPDHSYLNAEASLVIGEEMSFTAVRVTKDSQYYELAWAFPEEIALLASVTVAHILGMGRFTFFRLVGQSISLMKGRTFPTSESFNWQENSFTAR